MNIKRLLLIAGIILLVLLIFSCKYNKKPQAYTTTLEGIAIHVPSLTGGVINKLLVDEGNWINTGDTLAILDTRELHYQVDQIDASLQQIASQKVIASNNLKQSRVDLSYVQDKQQKTERLYAGDVVPRQNVEDIGNLVQKSQTQVTNAVDQLTLLQANAAILQAQKKILLKKINDAIILAPASGKITTLYYRQGEAMAPFTNLLEVIDTRTLRAKIYVSEAVLNSIKTGQRMQIITETGQTYPATVDHINNKAEFTPKTILTKDTRAAMVYAVTVIVNNPKDELKDGMPVEVDF